MLNKNELQKLRNQVVLNSVYVSDYHNNMGIDEHICCAFFDGYMSYISELFYEEYPNANDKQYWDEVWNYDTIETLCDWYYGYFEQDPLPITEEEIK